MSAFTKETKDPFANYSDSLIINGNILLMKMMSDN